MLQNNQTDIIIKAINNILLSKPAVIAAIDGRCAAGKTTLASQLEEKISCNIIHMDDFFLRPFQRTPERLNTPGGNVDYERFISEVLIPLKTNSAFSYAPYNCHTKSMKEPITVTPKQVTVIEGSYSCHPELQKYYDLRIFLDIDKNAQFARIEKRNPADEAKRFREIWIPLEEKYFSAFGIAEICDIFLN
ncbi:MAG: deoxynucleoside kinase [Clostridia bacterium]|nr:deoxynucleoside kinase [Clostridia bacterium]